jgi:endonuclease/exonuclease/phosphatase family metal-dependent hydrolase
LCWNSLLVLLILAGGCTRYHNIRAPDLPAPGTDRVTVLTYNIRTGAGLRKPGRSPYLLQDELQPEIEPIIAAIGSVQPDVTGLQEVLGEDQAAAIARALNMNYVYVPHGWERYGIWWGVALLSRFPIMDVWTQEISEGPGNTRSNLFARIDVGGTTWCVIVMHRDKDQQDGAALWRTMRAVRSITDPVVLLADLNIRPDDRRIAILSARFQDSLQLCGAEPARKAGIEKTGTLTGKRARAGIKRIDYILVDRGRLNVYDCGLFEPVHWPASDHIGYFAIIGPGKGTE